MVTVVCAAGWAAEQPDGFVGAATTTPAPRWEEGMLTGNGNMGGIALGNPYAEMIYVTQQEGFLPHHKLQQVPRAAAEMPRIKAEMLKVGKDQASLFSAKLKEVTGVKASKYGSFHPAFFLSIDMTPDKAEDYLQTMNLQNAEIVTQWSDSKGQWQRVKNSTLKRRTSRNGKRSSRNCHPIS